MDADATITSDESNSAGGVPPLNGKSTATNAVPAAALDEDTRDTTGSYTDNGSPVISADDLGENSASASSVSESTKDSMQVSYRHTIKAIRFLYRTGFQDEDSNSIGFGAKRPLNRTSDGTPAAKKLREEAK